MMNRLNSKQKKSGGVLNAIKQKFKSNSSTAKVSPAPLIFLNSETNIVSTTEKLGNINGNSTYKKETPDFLLSLTSSLVKAGENVQETLPLLNIFVAQQIEDSPITTKIGPDGRTFLLSGLLVRLVDLISSQKNLAIVIDDTQWMDSASWSIMLNIFRRCEKAVIVLASGPANDWRQTLLNEYRAKSNTESFILRGFNRMDLEQQFCGQFFWIDSVDKEMLDVIKDITEGNPAFLTNLIKYLKETPAVTVKGKKLIPAEGINEFQQAIPKTLEELLLWQYDSLRSKEFQKFLRIASVVGKEFSLEEVTGIMTDSQEKLYNRSLARNTNLIKICDSFGILEPVNPLHQHNVVYPFTHLFSFSATSFCSVIYQNRLTQSEKQGLHIKLIRFYEKQMRPENEPTFIPKICFHSQFTEIQERDAVLQQIQYMVMLGNYICLKAEMYKETIKLYKIIQSVIETHELEEVLGPNLLSEIHIRIGHAYSHGLPQEINLIQSLRHMMLAINLLDYEWPKSETEWWKLLAKEVLVWGWVSTLKPLYKLLRSKDTKKRKNSYINAFLGRDEYVANQKLDRLEHLQPILENMSGNLYHTDAPLLQQIGCNLLVLNNSYRMGEYGYSSDALKLSFATNFWFSGQKRLAIRIAEKITEKKDFDSQTYANGSLFWTVCGRWSIGLKWSAAGVSLSQTLGDLPNWLNCTQHISFIHLYNGHFAEVLKIEKQRIQECRVCGLKVGEKQAQISFTLLI
jgi:hypothetical protein